MLNRDSCVEFDGSLMADICIQGRLTINGVDVDINVLPCRYEMKAHYTS